MSSEDAGSRSQVRDLDPSNFVNTPGPGFPDFENRVFVPIGGENAFSPSERRDPVSLPEESEDLEDLVGEGSNSGSDEDRDEEGDEDPTIPPQPSGDHVVPSGFRTVERGQVSDDRVVPTGFVGLIRRMHPRGGLELQACLVPPSRKQKLSKEASSGADSKKEALETDKQSDSDSLASLLGDLKIDNSSGVKDKVAKRES